ncbi:MAG: hypothetical protein IT423_13995 [Pirellulaceae bacterium]|nr:hypothetical protein [Pirellulaceae bacterium]
MFWAWKGNAEVQQCGFCHYEAGNEFASRLSELSRFIELKLWLEKDKHAIARQRIEPIPTEQQAGHLADLRAKMATASQQAISIPDYWLGPSNALSARICQQLGKNVNTPDGYQWFCESCLTCHGGYEVQKSVANQGNKPKPPGISCSYCHQEANGNTQWIDLHAGLTTTDKWRALTPQQKATVGMRDLTPARDQAELCFQCHIGNIDKGMFVTHEMYAAGHPPLPAVELRTLIEEMPRHWQTPQDLLGKARDTHTIAVGALVAEKQWIELMVGAAASKHWGDYALYDCSACHHELRNDSRRQALRSPGAPGRPRMIEWPHPGAIAVTDSLGNKSFKSSLDQLHAAIKKRPFGDRQAVAQIGQTLSNQITESLDHLTLDRLPANYSQRLLSALCDTSAESLLDYQTARCVNWTARGLVQAVGEQDKELSDAEKRLAMLGQIMGPDGNKRVAVTQSLPATQSEIIYPDFVERELQRQQAYDSDAFTTQLREIGQALKP